MEKKKGRKPKGNLNKKNSSKIKEENKKNNDIKGIIYITIGILLSIAIYTELAGGLSILSRKVIYKIIGISAFVLPLYLIYFGYYNIVSKGNIKITRRIFGITLIIISITLGAATGSIHVLKDVEGFKGTWDKVAIDSGINGGFIGHLISYPLSMLIGYIGSYILYIALWSIGSILVFDITLYDLISHFKDNKKVIKEKRKVVKEEKKKQMIFVQVILVKTNL